MLLKYRLACDVGNSTTKAIIRLLSNLEDARAIKQKTLISTNVNVPAVTDDDLATSIGSLRNNMIAHINSGAIRVPGTFGIGERATTIGSTKRNMNIHIGDKHAQDIPIVMSLGLIATTAVQDYYKEYGDIPKDINVSVEYSTALPAREYEPLVAQEYERRFLAEQHIVDIYVNGAPVTVRIAFERVKATQEGVPAVFALVEGGEGLLDDYHKLYGKDVTNMDFVHRKLLLVDIGDGTTEYIYAVNCKPINDHCDGKRYGIGHAADVAKKMFDNETQVELKMLRQEFMQMVLNKEHHFHEIAYEKMSTARIEQAELIIEHLKHIVLNEIGGDVQDIVVFGGGSIALKDDMYDDLKAFCELINVRMLWVPKEMAASLNAIGLDILNEKLFFKGAVESGK